MEWISRSPLEQESAVTTRTSLPRPSFSSRNPYWQKITFLGVLPQFQPRLSARDFLYATAWEMAALDLHGAWCVRDATVKSICFYSWLGFVLGQARLEDRHKRRTNHVKVH